MVVSADLAKPQRIGILGGTFDPIHFGHLRAALDVQQQLELEQVRLIPLRDPAHREAPFASAPQRLKMLKLATQDCSELVVDDLELTRGGVSYTADTIKTLRQEFGSAANLVLILGIDAFRQFHLWYQPETILALANVVVVKRAGEMPLQPDLSDCEPALTALCADRMRATSHELLSTSSGSICQLEVTQLAISSTLIREYLSVQRNPAYLLPYQVLAFIKQQKLYTDI